MSLSCFVSGHQISSDHWYRNANEGTRVCGNAGHWIDLFVHVMGWREQQADVFHLSLRSANPAEPDDNFCLSISTDQSDIFSLMLTSRSEPFEGINETINIQHGDVICKIDDFRTAKLWKAEKFFKKRFWPKDVGHRLAILQAFDSSSTRNWDEVVRSSLLMLHVTDMVKNQRDRLSISMTDELHKLDKLVEAI